MRDPVARSRYEAELAVPPFPQALGYLWRAFGRLSNRRGSNGFSVCPITWPEIDAFVRNARFPLAGWEIETIEELDDLFRAARASKS